MDFDWSEEKNAKLRAQHGIGFERVLVAIEEGDLLAIRRHPNTDRYPHQRQFLVRIDAYVWIVPFVDDEGRYFLKTMFPSRRETKRLKGEMS